MKCWIFDTIDFLHSSIIFEGNVEALFLFLILKDGIAALYLKKLVFYFLNIRSDLPDMDSILVFESFFYGFNFSAKHVCWSAP